MKCLNCGEYIDSGQNFCSSCGKINLACPKCKKIVSGDDTFCGYCGTGLLEAVKEIKKLAEYAVIEERERKEREINETKVKQQQEEIYLKKEREKQLAESRMIQQQKEMRQYADDLIIECEGNKFKAIKEFKEKYNVDNDTASKYITYAYDKIDVAINNNQENYNNNSIENIVKRNGYDKIMSIKEVRDIYGYDLAEAKEKVDSVINSNKNNGNYVDPKGIKRTIIVSQSSRKKASSAIGRGIVGSAILGPVGLLAGASAKSKDTTTFQVIYNNGRQETVTVNNDSSSFKEYCRYLDK